MTLLTVLAVLAAVLFFGITVLTVLFAAAFLIVSHQDPNDD